MGKNQTSFQKGHQINRKYKYETSLSPAMAYYRRHKDELRKITKEKRRMERIRVLTYYCGDKKPFCQCCKEDKLEFLTLDHINGGGTKHRKSGIGNINYWIIKNKFPQGFQVLCHNCNAAKGYCGKCPHQL